MDLNDIIAANTGLIYQQLHRFNMVGDSDAESDAWFALYKAAETFDASKGYTFTTYAVTCISNSLRMLVRTRNRKTVPPLCSLQADIPNAIGIEDFTLAQLIPDIETTETRAFYNDLEEALPAITSNVLSRFEGDRRLAAKVWITAMLNGDKVTQQYIAADTGLSQAHVSRTIVLVKKYLREELEDYV